MKRRKRRRREALDDDDCWCCYRRVDRTYGVSLQRTGPPTPSLCSSVVEKEAPRWRYLEIPCLEKHRRPHREKREEEDEEVEEAVETGEEREEVREKVRGVEVRQETSKRAEPEKETRTKEAMKMMPTKKRTRLQL